MASSNISGSGDEHVELDQAFTDRVKAAVGLRCDERTRQLYCSLVQHVHDFVRENNVSMAEYLHGVNLINAIGAVSDETRNEAQLLMTVLGVESIVDENTHRTFIAQSNVPKDTATDTAILGPFWRPGAPRYPMGASIAQNEATFTPEQMAYVHGTVFDAAAGVPIAGAELDVWHADAKGLYEQQDPGQPEMNLRGIFVTGAGGGYGFYCVKPSSYPIPEDGPTAELLKVLDRRFMRPAHIHFIVSAPGYRTLVTQLFDGADAHLHSDTVFAVKQNLVVEFRRMPNSDGRRARYEVRFDFKLLALKEGSAEVG